MEAAQWEEAMQELVFASVDQMIIDISVGDTKLEVEAASSHTTRIAGLADRDDMPQDGMLFLYDTDVDRAFQRTTMNFEITIRFFDSAGQLVRTSTREPVTRPDVPYRYVLETHPDLALSGPLVIHGLA